jgi:RNA polymerase sigma-70 factor (ECF subfamily)
MMGLPIDRRPSVTLQAAAEDDPAWLPAFHRGDLRIIERCYCEHFAAVERALGGLLEGADRETVIHEVFSRIMGRPEVRRSFHGGSFGAWLTTLARNQAIDYRRRFGREIAASSAAIADGTTESFESAANARMMIERFRRERLPDEWQGVFELRFLQRLSQRDAAAELGLHRTTLVYRELRIRRTLRRFLRGGGL